MTGQGHRIFVDELARFAAGSADAPVTDVAERAAAPLRVAVRGRAGVGRGTVARALDRAGAAAGISADTRQAGAADLLVYVTAEVVKPEDVDAIAGAGCPVVVVLNKADVAGSLSGRAGDWPLAAAGRRCAELAPLVGAPMIPMSGLLAGAASGGPDPGSWAALRALAADPAGATCLDGSYAGFLAADVTVPTAARRRLLDALDLFGTALAIAAIRRGATPAQVRALLRRVSGVDAVLQAISVAAAEVRYRRVLDAVAELEALSVAGGETGAAIGGFLSRDDTVVARMAAAADLAEAAWLDGGADDDPAGHLPRAVRWQRFSRARPGPMSELHRACGADIARGSLRLWWQPGGSRGGGAR